MKQTEPRDAAAITVLAGGLLALLPVPIGQRVPAALVELLRSPPVLVALALAVLVLLGARVLRRKLSGRALSRRVRVQMIPTDGFAPEPEAVLRLAAALGRTRPAAGGLLTGPAHAARIRLDPDPDGRLRYTLEVPAHARRAVTAAGYGEVEQHDLDLDSAGTGEPSEPAPSESMAVARVELVLARPSTLPLRDIGLDPDPLEPVARALENFVPAARETATVCLDLLPITAAGRGRVRRRLLRQARRQHQPPPRESQLDLLGGGHPRGGARPDELVERRRGQRSLTSKLGSPEPLFWVQVLVWARARNRGRAVALADSLAGTLDQHAGENYFRATGLRLPGGLAFFGADSRLRRRRFDRRMTTGWFAPARRRIVTASEVAGWLKPPTASCASANVVRSGGLIPSPPPGLPTFHGQPDLLPLGRVTSAHGDRFVGVPLADTFFSYFGGRSRYGKTESALLQFVHLARSGHGVFFLDPHADAVARAKAFLTDQGLAERVVEINLANVSSQPGWNLFASHGLTPEQRVGRVDAIVDAFAAAMGWDETNTRALNLVTQSAQALIDVAARLPAPLAPTIFQIPALLGNERWRSAVLPHVSPATRQFFEDRFSRLPKEAITPVTNMVDRLRLAPSTAGLFGSPVSTYDVRRAMDRGQIVLACPGSGSVRDRLVASLLVYDVLHAARSRAGLAPERRRPFFAVFDEVQTYDGGAAGTLAAVLEQAAKYGVRACLLNQNPERLAASTLNAISTNRSHLAATALNAKAAALIAREWGGVVKPEVIAGLERFTYLISVTLQARISPPFLVRGVPVDEAFAAAHHPERLPALEAAIDRTVGRRPVSETVAALDEHDDAILHALRQLPPGGASDVGRGGHDLDAGSDATGGWS